MGWLMPMSSQNPLSHPCPATRDVPVLWNNTGRDTHHSDTHRAHCRCGVAEACPRGLRLPSPPRLLRGPRACSSQQPGEKRLPPARLAFLLFSSFSASPPAVGSPSLGSRRPVGRLMPMSYQTPLSHPSPATRDGHQGMAASLSSNGDESHYRRKRHGAGACALGTALGRFATARQRTAAGSGSTFRAA